MNLYLTDIIYNTEINDWCLRGLEKEKVEESAEHYPYKYFDSLITNAVKNNSKYILIVFEQERFLFRMNSIPNFWDNFNKKLIKNNLQFRLALSGHPKEKNLYSFAEKYSNIKIYNSPLYFLTFLSVNHSDLIEKFSNDIIELGKNNNFKKLFITLNCKPHDFRRHLMDMLCEYDLLKYSEYSWLKDDYYQNKTINFKCFDNKYKKLLSLPKSGYDWYWKDLLYGNPLINLVTESDDLTIGISEKTCKSILIGQPFIVYSQKGFHKILQEFGFELYDEIFDYSFDSLDSPKDRMKGICDNLNNLKDKDLLELYNSISHKLEKNKQTALDIVKNKKFIDKEYLKLLSENNLPFPLTDRNCTISN